MIIMIMMIIIIIIFIIIIILYNTKFDKRKKLKRTREFGLGEEEGMRNSNHSTHGI